MKTQEFIIGNLVKPNEKFVPPNMMKKLNLGKDTIGIILNICDITIDDEPASAYVRWVDDEWPWWISVRRLKKIA